MITQNVLYKYFVSFSYVSKQGDKAGVGNGIYQLISKIENDRVLTDLTNYIRDRIKVNEAMDLSVVITNFQLISEGGNDDE